MLTIGGWNVSYATGMIPARAPQSLDTVPQEVFERIFQYLQGKTGKNALSVLSLTNKRLCHAVKVFRNGPKAQLKPYLGHLLKIAELFPQYKGSLDLSYNNNVVIDARYIASFPALRTLNLRANALEKKDIQTIEWPQLNENLKNLTSLNISHCDLTSFPSLEGLESLITLDMCGNNFYRGERAHLANWRFLPLLGKTLTNVTMTWCSLDTLPPEMGALILLQKCNISGNAFGRTEEGIASLEVLSGCSRLTDLNISHCNLEKVPSVLERLVSLEIVNMKENALAEEKEETAQWHCLESRRKTLTDLDISDNGLSHIPAVISTLVNIRRLHMHKNPLQITEGIIQGSQNFKNLSPSLTDLDIGDCRFSQLPLFVHQLENLRSLNISYNNFTLSKEEITSNTALRHLLKTRIIEFT